MKASLSLRALDTPASPMRKLVPFAQSAKKRGIHVYHLNIGDPDIKTPQVMIDSLKKWKDNPIPYGNSQGNQPFINSLLWYYKRIGFNLDEKNIQVTLGGSEAILWVMLAVCNSGEEVIVFEPFYANYNSYAAMSGVNLVPVRTTIDDGFHLPDKNIIEKKITKKTRAILICNPSNPTGTLYTKKELNMLAQLAKKHKLFIFSDEVYREFVYDGKSQISLLNYAKGELKNKIVVLDSLSKRYSVCGARLGNIVSFNNDLMQAVLKFGQARLAAGFVDQVVGAQLNKVKKSYFQKVNKEYQQRRDVLYHGLNSIDGVVCPRPEGAFYIIAKLPIADATEFATFLLRDFSDKCETVMVAPADGFYVTKDLGKDEVRIAYVLNQKSLKRSVEIIAKALKKYNS